MKVGDLVRETIDGTIGTVTGERWPAGWLVYFPDHACEFYMSSEFLETINESR